MSGQRWTESDAAWEEACATLWRDILRQEHYNAVLDLCTFWQQHAINQLSQQYTMATVMLARNTALSSDEATWALYQFLACDALSSIHVAVRDALLLEIQILCSRIRDNDTPYPRSLEEAHGSLLEAVEKCAQETLALEAEGRRTTEQHAAMADENARLEERFRALKLAADANVDADSQVMSARRVQVTNIPSGASSIHSNE